jgi:hypothetical protein
MANEHRHIVAMRRTAIIVAYIGYSLGVVVLLLEREGRLLTKILHDFPGWRSITVIAVFILLALLIPWIASLLIKWYLGGKS